MTLRSLEALTRAGLMPGPIDPRLAEVAARYAIAVPPALARLIDPADPADPIARQFLPDARERDTRPNERADPIGDEAHSPCEGLVHRYPDRVLLKLVQVCAVYCRFCFRRETVGPGASSTLPPAALATALAYIAGHAGIWEVILTGGDPLSLAPRRLADVAAALGAIDHVRVLRLHTRVPVAAPERIDTALCEALGRFGRRVVVAVHANHPRELTGAARAACDRLAGAGISLVSQSVLLRGVNDDPDILAALMRGFVEAGIKPYYLHHPDLAPGTGHFRLSIAEGQAIYAALLGRVSGLCRPHYMLDVPGGYGKVPIGPSYVEPAPGGGTTVRDPAGRPHSYEP